MRETEANSITFAQASPSRLSESCRIKLGLFVSWNSLRRAGSELGDLVSRLGESGLPKRDRDVTYAF